MQGTGTKVYYKHDKPVMDGLNFMTLDEFIEYLDFTRSCQEKQFSGDYDEDPEVDQLEFKASKLTVSKLVNALEREGGIELNSITKDNATYVDTHGFNLKFIH
jgi:hypothetical protein